MREIIALTFEASVESWADEYGLTAEEAPADFADMVRRNVADPALVKAIENAWPAMRDKITAAYPRALDDGQRRAVLEQLIDGGLDFGTCVSAFADRQDESGRIEAAREQYGEDGAVEIDDNAIISQGADDGAYVMAWVWVANP